MFLKNTFVGLARRDGLDRLFLTGWRGVLACLALALVLSFFATGFWWPYWRSGDMDMWMVYEAFLQNERLPQEYFDHPAYLTILTLGWWLDLLHAIGLLPAKSLSTLPAEIDVGASANAWMRATQAARLLSLFYALSFAAAFAFLLRAWIRDWRIAALGVFLLVFSGGFMMQARIVRTELIAAGFCYVALLMCLVAARSPLKGWRPMVIGVAALFSTLAMENKVQSIFLIGCMPMILLCFGERTNAPAIWQQRRAAIAIAAAAVVLAFVAAWCVWPLVMTGLFDQLALTKRLLIFRTTIPAYQIAFVIWIAGWMLLYARQWRVSAIETVVTLAAVPIGIGMALLMLDVRLHSMNLVAVMNPVEWQLVFVRDDAVNTDLSGEEFFDILGRLFNGALLLLARWTFVLSSSPRPTIFLQWVVVAMAVYAWRKGEKRAVWQAAALMAAAWFLDLVVSIRALKLDYFLLSDPLVILAAAWLLARVPALDRHRFTVPVAVALGIATVAVGMAEPIKHTFRRDRPMDLCGPNYLYTKRINTFSYCVR